MKKLLLKLMLFIIPVLIYIGVGIYIDAYNVFHVDDIRFTKVVPNENFIKTSYIIEHKDRFNAFVFGSSRAGNLPKVGLPETAEDGTPLRWYNMTYSMGGIEENYMTLKSLTDAGVKVKEVLILIDEISMWKGASDSLDSLIFTTYQTYEKNPVAFYYSYLKQKPLLDLIPEIYAGKHSERIGDQDYMHPKYYYDASHFRPYVGYEMEKAVFGNVEKKEGAIQGASLDGSEVVFGTKVTKENVDDVIKRMNYEIYLSK